MSGAFFDTNILVYCVDWRDKPRQAAASALVRQHSAHGKKMLLSTQVLIEYFNATTSARVNLLTRAQATLQIGLLAQQHQVISTNAALVLAAAELAEQNQLQWFDALIVQAAIAARAKTLYSEDLQHGRRFGELAVVNPFAA